MSRIDDGRFGRGHSYRVSLDEDGGSGKLPPRIIYHFWGPDSLRITGLDELMALRDLPDAFTVLDTQIVGDVRTAFMTLSAWSLGPNSLSRVLTKYVNGCIDATIDIHDNPLAFTY